MLILVSGLPRAGKSSFAEALEVQQTGFTHVPLDKYIMEVPADTTFLDWVAVPQCIDWPLLQTHLAQLAAGQVCFTPAPDWDNRGKRKSIGGAKAGGRRMQPAARGYVIPGCYALRFPGAAPNIYRVFISTPHIALAERLVGRPVVAAEVADILAQRLSPNWPEIEAYAREADLVLAGDQPEQAQIQVFLNALNSR